MQSNVEIAREYVKAIESGATGDSLARFFASDVVIREMPNRVAPNGSTSDLTKALQGAERGKQLFQRQTYTIINMMSKAGTLLSKWIGLALRRSPFKTFLPAAKY